jgi:hypothetical protein
MRTPPCSPFWIAVWRERHYLRGGKVFKEEEDYADYVSSADPAVYDEERLLEAVRGHWDAIENGSHHRRDVSMGEDASGISKRTQAHIMATLRNLTLGWFERQKHQSTKGFPSWRRRMTRSQAIRLLCSKQ